jgi:hypothetical protein
MAPFQLIFPLAHFPNIGIHEFWIEGKFTLNNTWHGATNSVLEMQLCFALALERRVIERTEQACNREKYSGQKKI